MIKNENYYQIAGWMVNELKLKGVELNLFAIIYGFSQDEESEFTGNRQYLADFIGVTRPTIDKALSNLIERQLIIKTTKTLNGVIFNSYRVNFTGCKESLQGGCKISLQGDNDTTNNERIDYLDNKISDNKEERVKALFEEFWKTYPRKVDKKGSYKAFKNIPNIVNVASSIIADVETKKYSKQWMEPQYIPHPTTYLHQERWLEKTEKINTGDWFDNYWDEVVNENKKIGG